MSDIPAALKNIDLNAALRRRGMFLQLEKNKALKEAARPIARKLLTKKEKAPEPRRHQQFTNEVVMAYWEKQIRIVEILENKFENKVQQFVNKIVDGFLKHIDQEVSSRKGLKNFKAKDYFDDAEDDLLVQAQFDFTPLLMDQVLLAGQEAYKLIGSDDVYLPDRLREKIRDNVTKFTQSMLDTDRDTLIKILTDGLDDGKSIPEIRGLIQADFENISKNQAQRITRTEILRASNQGALDAYEQSGVVEGKQWLTAGAVDECAAYDGQIVTLSGNFYGSDNEFQDGDPPLHPNCRCVILPVLVDEKAYIPDSSKLYGRIKELEEQVDKRTKAFKEAKAKSQDDAAYIKALEGLLDGR